MAANEGLEGLGLAGAMCEVGAEQLFYRRRAILTLHVAPKLAPDRRVGAKTATHHHMEAFDRISLVIDGDPASDQSDIADIVLGAGIWAARQMDINCMLDLEPRLNVRGDACG